MCPAAARLNDPIAHTSMLGNLAKMGGLLIAGALVGAALTFVTAAAVTFVVGTGGLGLGAVLAIGFAASMAMEGSGLNEFIDHQINRLVDAFIPPPIEGKIASGSWDVNVNSQPAARAASPDTQDTVACDKHASGPSPMLAQGSDNVFINNHPAARKGDQTTCGGTIAAGSDDVFIGGGTVTVREIHDERPWWINALGMALGVITGGKVLREAPDIALPGPLPFEWTRFYSSHDRRRRSVRPRLERSLRSRTDDRARCGGISCGAGLLRRTRPHDALSRRRSRRKPLQQRQRLLPYPHAGRPIRR